MRSVALDLTRCGVPTPSGAGQTWTARAAIDRLLADAIAKQRYAAKAIVALGDEEIAAPIRDDLHLLGKRRNGLRVRR